MSRTSSRLLLLLLCLCRLACAVCVPPRSSPEALERPVPVVLWHGLGDVYDSYFMKWRGERVSNRTGGYVLSIYADVANDRRAGYYGNVNQQVDSVCAILKEDPELENGFHAMGFSQGGQFLRAYVERCNDPPVKSLVTWGAQHFGIASLPACPSGNFLCRGATALFKSGVWTSWVRKNIIQAQYYRNPRDMDNYLEYSEFLADINNERESKNVTYGDNMAQLEHFVMVQYKQDVTVVPRESSLFDELDADGEFFPLREHDLYTEDWIGLKRLDQKNKLVQMTVEGVHLDTSDQDFDAVVDEYCVTKQTESTKLLFQPRLHSRSFGGDSMTGRVKALSVFEVVYDPQTKLGLVMAILSVIPPLLLAMYGTMIFTHREIRTVFMLVGQLGCEGTSYLLKELIQQDRPVDTHGEGFGMPSSHSSFMGFFATYATVDLVLRCDMRSLSPLDQLFRVVCFWLLAISVCASRVLLNYHTIPQAIAGLLVGTVLALGWQVILSVFERTGMLDTILDLRISQWLCLKDSLYGPVDRLQAEWNEWRESRNQSRLTKSN